jgi:ligand-binding sensor domain-containing protein
VLTRCTTIQRMVTDEEDRLGIQTLCIYIAAFLLTSPACALSPELRIAQFYHTAWTAKDGAPTGIYSLTQTSDGYLWMASYAGLFRFDGVRFEHIDTVRGQPLPSQSVASLFAPRSGGLWVGYAFGGASFISGGRITSYGEREGLPGSSLISFAQDQSGVLWAATTRGLRRFDGSMWVDVNAAFGLPEIYRSGVSFDRSGTMWVRVDRSIMYLQPGQHTFAKADFQIDGEIAFLEGPDGTLWLSDGNKGIRALYVPLGSANASEDWISLGDTQFGHILGRLIDRDGTLWMVTSTDIRRLRLPAALHSDKPADAATADRFSDVDGLMAQGVITALEDREGNVWLGTAGGLDLMALT